MVEAEGDAEHATVRSTLRNAIQAAGQEYLTLQQQSSHTGSKVPVPLVVVCGTAFVMAEARAELGVQEPRDSESLSDPLSSADLADFNRNIDAQVVLSCLFDYE